MNVGSAIQLLVMAMMFSVGVELHLRNLRGTWWGPRIAIGLMVNLVLFPLLTVAVLALVDESDGFRIGLLLCAAAPGGPVGPVLGRIAGADLDYSTLLMVALGVVGLLSTPLTASLMIASSGPVLVGPMFMALLIFQIVPLAFGQAVRHLSPVVADRLVRPTRLVSNLLLVAVVAALLTTRGATLRSVDVEVHAALVGCLLLVLTGACVWAPPGAWIRGLAVVTSFRNVSVALLLGSRLFDDPAVEAAILVWAFWMVVLPIVVGLLVTRFATADPRVGRRLPART